MLVAASALQEVTGAPLPYLLVVDGAGRVHRKSVEIGRRGDHLVEIHSGLQAGDRIVVSGGYGLPDGTEIDPEP
jgi:multidrug efflux system membrane fusion protein